MEHHSWPALDHHSWARTRYSLHMWLQVVGKIRLACTPLVNHWWQVPLYVGARGLTTSVMFFGRRPFEIEVDLIEHNVRVTSPERQTVLPLHAEPVASFYARLLEALREQALPVRIWPTPVEVEAPVRFDQDTEPGEYDPAAARRFWEALVQTHRVFTEFRARFTGKVSPVHFFWGSFDLAVTRFSGRPAPDHPGVPGMPLRIVREAYSHEVSSAGFWPGDSRFPEPAFYCYAYPAPPGFADASAQPATARFAPELGEFVLPYDVVRRAGDGDRELLAFLESTYAAAADLAGWDRRGLERSV